MLARSNVSGVGGWGGERCGERGRRCGECRESVGDALAGSARGANRVGVDVGLVEYR